MVLRQFRFNLLYAKALVEGVSEEQMTLTSVKGLENHAAFTLGHLITGSAMTVEDMGGTQDLPDGWSELFARRGPGDPRYPEKDRGQYPNKEALLNELERQHQRVEERIVSLSDEEFAKPLKWRFSDYMPTLWDVVVFMCINHEAMHLGQLAGWRRNLGLPSALATL